MKIRYKNFNVDIYGFLVSVLSVLITVLIGWNVYTIIDFNNKRKQMRSDIEKIKQELSNTALFLQKEHNNAIYGVMGELALICEKNHNDYKFVNFMLSSVMYGLRSGIDISSNIKAILELRKATGLKMEEFEKSLVLDTFYHGIKPYCQDANIKDLEKLIMNIKTDKIY